MELELIDRAGTTKRQLARDAHFQCDDNNDLVSVEYHNSTLTAYSRKTGLAPFLKLVLPAPLPVQWQPVQVMLNTFNVPHIDVAAIKAAQAAKAEGAPPRGAKGKKKQTPDTPVVAEKDEQVVQVDLKSLRKAGAPRPSKKTKKAAAALVTSGTIPWAEEVANAILPVARGKKTKRADAVEDEAPPAKVTASEGDDGEPMKKKRPPLTEEQKAARRVRDAARRAREAELAGAGSVQVDAQ